MARYATWRKHREQRARAVQQAIFMPTKRGSRAIARYAHVFETTWACVCLPGPSGSKEWLSSRPIDRLESKITRFLAAHSQARSRTIVPDAAASLLSSLFFSLPLLFFVKAKAAARCNKPVLLFRALRSPHVPLQLVALRSQQHQCWIDWYLFEVRSSESPWENVYALSVAERLTRFSLRIAVIHSIWCRWIDDEVQKINVAAVKRTLQSMCDKIFLLNIRGS